VLWDGFFPNAVKAASQSWKTSALTFPKILAVKTTFLVLRLSIAKESRFMQILY
jgi:hypothetical protein